MAAKVTDGKLDFFFFKSVFPDVRCSLFPDWSFIICAGKPFTFMQLGGGVDERFEATWHPCVLWTVHNFPGLYWLVFGRLCFQEADKRLFFC